MSGTTVTRPTAVPHRRVRHELRDSLAVMGFSALASCLVAALLMIAVRLGS